MTITCRACGKDYSFERDSMPYVRIDCFSEEIRHKREYRPECPHCQTANIVIVAIKEQK